MKKTYIRLYIVTPINNAAIHYNTWLLWYCMVTMITMVYYGLLWLLWLQLQYLYCFRCDSCIVLLCNWSCSRLILNKKYCVLAVLTGSIVLVQLLSVLVHACCLALLDACLPLSSTFSAATCGFSHEGQLIIDPTVQQEKVYMICTVWFHFLNGLDMR